MRRRILIPALTLAAISLALPPAANAREVIVTITNFAFTPQRLTVSAGDTVTFVNEDDMIHSVVASDGSFHSDGLDTHDKVSFTPARAGRLAYFCGLHPFMKGEIDVK